MVEDTPEVKRVKELMKEVYGKGFNIYQCLNRLKKELKLTEDFPAQAIIWTCESYLHTKTPIAEPYPWFVRVFTESSRRYFFEKNRKVDKNYKKESVPQSIKDIMKGIK